MLTSSLVARGADENRGIARRLIKPIRQARLLEAIGEVLATGKGAADVPHPSGSEAADSPEGPAPAAPPPARSPAEPADAPGSPRGPSISPGRILVAEDHDVNWMLIERMLSGRGHEVNRARDGDEVLEMVGQEDYDMVLMDCQMPGRDGYDATLELRQRGVHARRRDHLPIVAMTASALDESKERCREVGMDDYVGKPILPEELDRVLERWLPGEPEAGVATSPPVGEAVSSEQDEPVAALDPGQIEQIRRMFPGEKMLEVVREMCDEMTSDLDELTAALEASDQARVAAAAHRIRNTGRALGARELVDTAAELDQPPRQDRPPAQFDEAAVVRIRASWAEVRAALSALSGEEGERARS
jgi:CheY-like chemotaxis protein